MIHRILFLIYFQHDYRPDMKANLAFKGTITSFTVAAYFGDIDWYLKKREEK